MSEVRILQGPPPLHRLWDHAGLQRGVGTNPCLARSGSLRWPVPSFSVGCRARSSVGRARRSQRRGRRFDPDRVHHPPRMQATHTTPPGLGGDGLLAQMGERLLCTQEVVGSIPTGSTILSQQAGHRTRPGRTHLSGGLEKPLRAIPTGMGRGCEGPGDGGASTCTRRTIQGTLLRTRSAELRGAHVGLENRHVDTGP